MNEMTKLRDQAKTAINMIHYHQKKSPLRITRALDLYEEEHLTDLAQQLQDLADVLDKQESERLDAKVLQGSWKTHSSQIDKEDQS